MSKIGAPYLLGRPRLCTLRMCVVISTLMLANALQIDSGSKSALSVGDKNRRHRLTQMDGQLLDDLGERIFNKDRIVKPQAGRLIVHSENPWSKTVHRSRRERAGKEADVKNSFPENTESIPKPPESVYTKSGIGDLNDVSSTTLSNTIPRYVNNQTSTVTTIRPTQTNSEPNTLGGRRSVESNEILDSGTRQDKVGEMSGGETSPAGTQDVKGAAKIDRPPAVEKMENSSHDGRVAVPNEGEKANKTGESEQPVTTTNTNEGSKNETPRSKVNDDRPMSKDNGDTLISRVTGDTQKSNINGDTSTSRVTSDTPLSRINGDTSTSEDNSDSQMVNDEEHKSPNTKPLISDKSGTHTPDRDSQAKPQTLRALPKERLPFFIDKESKTGHTGTPSSSEWQEQWNDTKLVLTLHSQGDSVTASWVFESNNTRFTGFVVTYRINNREHYDSSKLGKYVRSFTLHSLHEDEDYVICVHAMVNTTSVKDACEHWNETSVKMVVGIMAGTLFLIPCIIVVIWILHKDKQVRKKLHQEKKNIRAADDEEKILYLKKGNGASQHCKHDKKHNSDCKSHKRGNSKTNHSNLCSDESRNPLNEHANYSDNEALDDGHSCTTGRNPPAVLQVKNVDRSNQKNNQSDHPDLKVASQSGPNTQGRQPQTHSMDFFSLNVQDLAQISSNAAEHSLPVANRAVTPDNPVQQ